MRKRDREGCKELEINMQRQRDSQRDKLRARKRYRARLIDRWLDRQIDRQIEGEGRRARGGARDAEMLLLLIILQLHAPLLVLLMPNTCARPVRSPQLYRQQYRLLHVGLPALRIINQCIFRHSPVALAIAVVPCYVMVFLPRFRCFYHNALSQ